MRLSPSAHLDTFCRDRLPPPDQWPEFRFDLPELNYPERLNCAAELLDATAARDGADRPCLLSPTETWTLRRDRPPDQPAGPGADRGLRPAPGQPGDAPRPEHPVARRRLARRDQGRRGRGHHHGPAAPPGDRHHRGADRAEPGPVRSPLRRGPGGRGAGADRAHLRRGRPRRSHRPLRGQGRHVHPGRYRRRRRGHARVDLGHHRPAEGRHALPPGRAGHRGQLLQVPDQAAPGRRLHRHSPARLHLRARRPAAVPAPRGRVDAAHRARHPGRTGRRDRGPRRDRAVHRADRLPGHAGRGQGLGM